MKRILTFALALTFALSLFSCSAPVNEADALAYDYDLSEYAVLPVYKGMKLTKAETTPTAEQIEEQKKTDFAGKEVSRAAKDGDTVIIDYTGKKDGVAFEGGTAQMQSLTLGSGSFIDGFEEGLVGVKPGETVDLDLTFPDPYENNPDLAGAKVVFTVKMHYIKTDSTEVPKLTDEIVAALTEYKTVADYEKAVNEDLADDMLDAAVQDKLYNGTEFKKLPDDAQKVYRDRYIQSYKDAAAAYGMSFSNYLAQNGTNETEFLAQAKSYAKGMVESDLILLTISRAEDITPTKEQRTAALEMLLEDYSAQYGVSSTKELEEMLGEEETDRLVLNYAVIQFVRKNAVIEG